MFKRLRENLFGRPGQAPAEDQQEPIDQPEIEPAQAADRSESEYADEAEPDIVEAAAAPEPSAIAPTDTVREVAPPAVVVSPAASTPSGVTEDEAEVEYADEEMEANAAEEDLANDGEVPAIRHGLFKNPFRFSLGRTRQLFGRVNQALAADDITDDLWDELEETLISSDVGVTTSERLMATLRERAQAESMTRGRQLRDALKEELELLLGAPEPLVFSDTSPLTAFLVVGVNGVGKTTSIAKLAQVLKRGKHRVLLAAGDTFRAAATEQIKLWGERIGVPVVSHQHGADPAAVVFDAVQAAQARNCDVLIVDTAGRLHTKYNLMEELKKIGRVLQKYDAEAPHEVLLVIDATTGQNGYLQAKQFIADAGVSGVILTKLDGTARGGIVFAIASELGLPIKYIGTGEKVQDLAEFDPVEFVDALFADE